jgi:hypothetical protein
LPAADDRRRLETIIIDESASEEQRRALETILTGCAGGPWEKLASFVGARQPTEFRAIVIDDAGPVKRASIGERLKTIVTQIRGRDRTSGYCSRTSLIRSTRRRR